MKRALISTAVAVALGSSINVEANTAGLTGTWTGTYIFGMLSPSGGSFVTSALPQSWEWDFDNGTISIVNENISFFELWTAHDVTFVDQGTYYGTDAPDSAGGVVNMLWDYNIFTTNVPITAGWDVTASGNAVSDTAIVSVAFSTITAGADVFWGFHPQFSGSLHKISTVPVPAAAWLMGSGLIGLIGVARRKKV